jgi:hypothetical protein
VTAVPAICPEKIKRWPGHYRDGNLASGTQSQSYGKVTANGGARAFYRAVTVSPRNDVIGCCADACEYLKVITRATLAR